MKFRPGLGPEGRAAVHARHGGVREAVIPGIGVEVARVDGPPG